MRKTEKPVIHGNCNFFFSKTFLRRHQKECQRGKQRISHQVYNVIPSLEYTYVKEILTRFHQDAVADICTKDDTLVTIGKYMWAKHKHKKDQVLDCRKIVLREMRRLATLYRKVKDQEGDSWDTSSQRWKYR